MKQSERLARLILQDLGFENVKKMKGFGRSDFKANRREDQCTIEVKSVRKGEITKDDARSTATLKRHQISRMAEEKHESNIRPFVLYLDSKQYFLFELIDAGVLT